MATQSRKPKAASGKRPARPPAAATPGDLLSQAKRFGVSQTLVVRLTGYSPRAVAKWAGGEKPSDPARKSLAEMYRILEALGGIMDPAEVGLWLREPNPAFDGSTPSQVIERGESDRIWRMIYRLESGEPG